MLQDYEITEEYAYRCCPQYLKDSIDNFKKDLDNYTNGYRHYIDCSSEELSSDINCAEIDGEINEDIAWYLRKVYLGRDKNELN